MQLRDYQQACVNSVWQYYLDGKKGNILLALPTASGKAVIQAFLMQSMLNSYPQTKILALTHVKELIEQNFKTLHRLWRNAPAGIFSAGLKRKDFGYPITFAGIQSIKKRAIAFRHTDIIFIDEAHLVSDADGTSYAEFIAELKKYKPALKVIGLTATPYRLGQGLLTDGKLFHDIAFDLTSGEAFVWLLEQGYLAPLYPKATSEMIDISDIKTTGGDFNAKQLHERIAETGIIDKALAETIKFAADRKHWLIFSDSIENCETTAEKLNTLGIKAAALHSKLPGEQRDKRIAAFKAGHLRALVNQGILTTGFDFPELDCLVLLRPTKSPGLHVQICGRGTRPAYAPGFDLSTQDGRLAAMAAGPKSKGCLVLDFARNTERLGPINYPQIPKRKGKGGGEAPLRVCPTCATYVHISVRKCPVCGYEFPILEKRSPKASERELIARGGGRDVDIFRVDRMFAVLHQKTGKPDSVRVEYHVGSRSFNVFVGLEHPGYMAYKARRWCERHRVKRGPIPKTTRELLAAIDAGQYKTPSHVRVSFAEKWPEVLDFDFTGLGFPPPPTVEELLNGTRKSSTNATDGTPERAGQVGAPSGRPEHARRRFQNLDDEDLRAFK